MAGDLTPDDVVVPQVGMHILVPVADGVRLIYRVTEPDENGTFGAEYVRGADDPDWRELPKTSPTTR